MESLSTPSAGNVASRRGGAPFTRRRAFLDLVSLGVCLLGFIGLTAVVWGLKTETATTSRPVFLLMIALVCAPFFVALVRRPKIPFLLPPIVAIFLLYPVASPHGVVFTSDPIFNYAFARNILTTGLWTPGVGAAFASTYSFYPIGNVFNAFVIASGQLPGATAYMWVEPLVRLAALPAIVYAIGRRVFGPRTAALGLLLYLGTASILFNVPVQQGMGVIFVGLSLLALVILTQSPGPASQHRVVILFAITSGAIVMTHHLSSYVFAAWFAAVAVMTLRRTNWGALTSRRLSLLFLYFLAVLGLYIALFTYQIFQTQQLTLQGVIQSFVAPEQGPVPQAPAVGRTFSTFEIGWLGGSVLALMLLSLVTIRRNRRAGMRPFAMANGIVAVVGTFATLPLIVTSVNYVPLRISEYTNLFLAPFAAATLLRYSQVGLGAFKRWLPSGIRKRRSLVPVSAAVVCALLVMGGNLAPLSMRTYYESPSSRTTDAQLNIGADSFRAADWATAHFGDGRIWGDQLIVDVYTGFSDMQTPYGSLAIFNDTNLTPADWSHLAIGDYIAVDSYMLVLRPNWFHQPLSPAPLNASQVDKFSKSPYLALVYDDATYSVYRVMSKPP